ncbi:hypothetical protein [Bacillus bingmayongensis]|uniref:hypothetical protein n=1 Tax=Bacillus bingmayongensis TaxID=1150157 RepID=UPI000314AA4A|nr:hypothetical protein [Bacillus bingmayongensis]
MAIQKMHKADKLGNILIEQVKGAYWVRVARVENTCWYSLKDTMGLLEVLGKTSTIASHIPDENKRLFSFGSRPTFVVDLKGIHAMTTMFEINDWSLLVELVERVATVFNSVQELVSMELDKEMHVPRVTQEDMLALEVLNAENSEERVLALTAYKEFITQ